MVYKGVCKKTGEPVAIKVIQKSKLKEQDLEKVVREVEIMEKLKHENIVRLIDVFEEAETVNIVLELYAASSRFITLSQRRGWRAI